jgi:hypothetical protein
MGYDRMGFDHFFRTVCDVVALLYHEGRNVRHLVRQGLLDQEQWRFLMSLPINREDAWREISAIRHKAQREVSVEGALRVFESRFHVSLRDLAEMFANENWRRAKMYGGNAWARIDKLTAELADAMRNQEVEAAEHIMTELRNARHNTGFLFEKLARLQKANGRNEKPV